jgi:hypothetical protein
LCFKEMMAAVLESNGYDECLSMRKSSSDGRARRVRRAKRASTVNRMCESIAIATGFRY